MRRSLVLLTLLSAIIQAADPVALVSGYDPSVRTFTLTAAGVLQPLATSPIGANPSFLAVAADGRMVYACSEVSPGRVLACTFDRGTGTLVTRGQVGSGGAGPCHLAIHPGGRWLLVAHYGDGRVAALPIGGDGLTGEPVSVVDAGVNAHMALPDAGGTTVLVPCKGSDRLVGYLFSPADGSLAPATSVATAPGAGPRHVVRGSDPSRAWLVNELANTVQPLRIASDGSLQLGEAVSTLPTDWSRRNTAGGIVLSSDGRQLVVSNRGHDSLALFDLDEAGVPHPAGHVQVGAKPRHIAVSPDGRHILVACQDGNRVDVLGQVAGTWVVIGGVQVPRPAYVGFAP